VHRQLKKVIGNTNGPFWKIAEATDGYLAARENEYRASIMLQPLFEKALSDRSITAWVCSSDPQALMALEFVRARGKTVPKDISVMGFDDTTDAYNNGLTSYNFDIGQAAYRMLNFILDPRTESRGPTVVEIPGMVVERETTGVPPQRDNNIQY
jgi:DNA-binding LacI/PurR family transcriptional regulator